MRYKWWLWLGLLLGVLWGGGQRVQALTTQDLLFENVTWDPSSLSPAIVLAPPKEVWVAAGTRFYLYFALSQGTLKSLRDAPIPVVTPIQDGSTAPASADLANSDGALLKDHGTFSLKFTTVGTRIYRINPGIGWDSFARMLTVHVIESLPPNLMLNLDGLTLFDFVPVQPFLVDDAGRKYLDSYTLYVSNPEGKIISTLINEPVLSEYSSSLEYLTYSAAIRPPGVEHRIIGTFTRLHRVAPIVVDSSGNATVSLPVIMPPASIHKVQFVWMGPDKIRHILPIEPNGTVRFTDLSPINFPMTWSIEYTLNKFDGDKKPSDHFYDYADITGRFATPLDLDLPAVPLKPLFTGTYTLQQIAEGPVAVMPAWTQLTLTAAGPWRLELRIEAPTALPMRLQAFDQETGSGEAPITATGADETTLSLAESRLLILPNRALSPGVYTANITFTLIRAPNA